MQFERCQILLSQVAADFRASWRPLAVVHIFYGAVASVLLAPLMSVFLRIFVAISGKEVLSDLDILHYLLSPLGLVAGVLIGAIALTIAALQLAVLMVIGFGKSHDRPVTYWQALAIGLKQTPAILRVSVEVIGRSALAAAPFLAAGGVVYVALLGRHDINFYLSNRPPVFWMAGALIGSLLLLMAIVLLRLMSGWVFALPLLLFEQTAPAEAVAQSKRISSGTRWWIFQSLAVWGVASAAFGSFVTGAVGGLGRLFVPTFATSLPLLIGALGVLVVAAAVANFIVAFVNTSALALMVVRLFRDAGRGNDLDAAVADLRGDGEPTRGWRLTVRWIVWGALVFAVIAIVAGVSIARGVRLEDHTEIMAHRGASAFAPENTLAAVREAIAAGANWVEIDVQETADGEVVVLHDSDFKKVAGLDQKIWDVTAEQLDDIDIGSFFAAEFADERVPTLAEVLETCKGRIGVNIELKYYGQDQQLEERVVQIVEAEEMADDVILMSLSYEGVQKIRELRPTWKIGLLTTVSVGEVTKQDLDFLAVNARAASPAFVKRAQRQGKQVLVWTVNDAIGMSQMMSRGVDGIITDDPALGVEVLRQRAALTPVERLLLELADEFGIKTNYAVQ